VLAVSNDVLDKRADRLSNLMLLFFVISQFAGVPPSLQDMLAQVGMACGIGYIAMFFIEMYNTSPFLIAIPILGLVIIIHFVLVSGRDRSELAVHPAPDTTEGKCTISSHTHPFFMTC
jgi:hypothetical protein